MYLKMGMAYDGAAASLRSFGAIAHCPAWHGLQLAGDMAIGDSHGLHMNCRLEQSSSYDQIYNILESKLLQNLCLCTVS